MKKGRKIYLIARGDKRVQQRMGSGAEKVSIGRYKSASQVILS